MPETTSTMPMSTIGLKNVVIAQLTKDDATETTYGTVSDFVGAIEASITPQNTDPEVQYAGDGEYDTVYPDPELEFRLQMADIPLDKRKLLFDNKIDQNGVLVKNASDKPTYFAVGFKSEKADHTYRYVWLYKVRATPMTENYATKEGDTITRQTGEIVFTAIKRTSDGQYQAVADEGANGFTTQNAATLLTTVYTPRFAA